MSSSRFGFYLLPHYPIARDISEIHSVLDKQFGFKAAGRFQVHCTIKRFFKKTKGPIKPLIAALDALLAGEKPFRVALSETLTWKLHRSWILE